jgi:cysteine desulfurase
VIYLDHNATTPVRPEAALAMFRALTEVNGNPSSVHAAGRQARAAIEGARARVARLADVLPEEIVFVSSGTEGDNQVVRGLAAAGAKNGRKHVISSRLEHPAVQQSVEWLAAAGHPVSWLPVSANGDWQPGDVERELRADTALVTLALANHEVGNVYPLRQVVDLAGRRGAWVHTDAVQAIGKFPVSLRELGVDAATFSAHKLGGPKGVGAVFIRRGLDLPPLLAGGHQERERHPGTENVAGIVGFGAAAEVITAEHLRAEAARLADLRLQLEHRLRSIAGARLHGNPESPGRAPGTTSVGFAGAPAHLVVIALDLEGICVSTGAACTSGTSQPSAVLRAMGQGEVAAAEAIRISLGWTTVARDIDALMDILPEIVGRVRAATAHPVNGALGGRGSGSHVAKGAA